MNNTLNVGDEVKPKLEGGKHWLSNEMAELALEEERKITNKSAPSRLNCVYSSLVHRGRFIDKGYLYRVIPTKV